MSPAAAILRLLADRREGATICPSEAARAIDPDGWRARMPEVHAAARGLAQAGQVALSQRGAPLGPEDARGAYRIGRPGG